VTSWLLADGGLSGALRNIVNLVLLDQVEGFLLGVVFITILSAPLWAARKSAGWCIDKVRRMRRRRG
jgi:type III secretory pathway component EscT